MESGSMVWSIYCAHMAPKWSCVFDSQPKQGRDMSVEAYYDQFFNWKKKLEEVNYICDEGWYIEDFLCGLKIDLVVRVWAYKWKPLTLYGAFLRAQFEEMLSWKELNADKVFEEKSLPNSVNIAESKTEKAASGQKTENSAHNVLDKMRNSAPTGLPSFSRSYVNEDEALFLVLEDLKWLFEESDQSSPLKLNDVGVAHEVFDESSTTYLLEQTAEKGELLGSVVPVSTLHECELLGNEGGQPHLLRMRSIKADHQMFERMPELNNRATVHGELVLPRNLSYGSEVTMGSFSISSKSMFEEVFMFIDIANHEFGADCWVDGISRFIFDPGVYRLDVEFWLDETSRLIFDPGDWGSRNVLSIALGNSGSIQLGTLKGDQSHVSTQVMGTYGYCAPEYASLFRNEGNDYLSSKITGLQFVCQLNEEMYANCLSTKLFDTWSSFLIDDDVGLTARTNFSVFEHLVSIGVIGVDLRSYVWKPGQYTIPYILEDKDVVKRNGIGVSSTKFSSKSKIELNVNLWVGEISLLVFDPGGSSLFHSFCDSFLVTNDQQHFDKFSRIKAISVIELVEKFVPIASICYGHLILAAIKDPIKGKKCTACHLKDSQDINEFNEIDFASFFPTQDVMNKLKTTNLMKAAAEFGQVLHNQLDGGDSECHKRGVVPVAGNLIRIVINDTHEHVLVAVSGNNIEKLRNSFGATTLPLARDQTPSNVVVNESNTHSLQPSFQFIGPKLELNSAEYVNVELMLSELSFGDLIGRCDPNTSRIDEYVYSKMMLEAAKPGNISQYRTSLRIDQALEDQCSVDAFRGATTLMIVKYCLAAQLDHIIQLKESMYVGFIYSNKRGYSIYKASLNEMGHIIGRGLVHVISFGTKWSWHALSQALVHLQKLGWEVDKYDCTKSVFRVFIVNSLKDLLAFMFDLCKDEEVAVNFVWNPGIFRFTTLRTRRLLRGRICHVPRSKIRK